MNRIKLLGLQTCYKAQTGLHGNAWNSSTATSEDIAHVFYVAR